MILCHPYLPPPITPGDCHVRSASTTTTTLKTSANARFQGFLGIQRYADFFSFYTMVTDNQPSPPLCHSKHEWRGSLCLPPPPSVARNMEGSRSPRHHHHDTTTRRDHTTSPPSTFSRRHHLPAWSNWGTDDVQRRLCPGNF